MRYQLELERIMPATGTNCLTPQERQHYLSLKTEKRRQEWLAGRTAAKRLVRKTIEGLGFLIQEENIAIEQTANGVPFAQAEANAWPLSIAHSGEWAAVVMPDDPHATSIGVDIEKIEVRDPAWLDIAFHPLERAEDLDPAGQTQLWTKKEAVSKLLGIGLSTDLLDIRFPAKTGVLELYGKAKNTWETLGCPVIAFDSPSLCPGYIVSVAYTASPVCQTQEASRAYVSIQGSQSSRREGIHG